MRGDDDGDVGRHRSPPPGRVAPVRVKLRS
jgi:hypothetical protein